MSKIHEILHTKKLERISTEEHFEKLISKIRTSYIDLDVKIKLNINTNLQGEQTNYLGIILNELITNSFKYAFKEKKGEINISLIKENNKNLVRIYDNGIGFDYNWQNVNSFGLLFVEAMVKDELAGKIDFINDNGTKIDIVF
jgi:two-component sensor histidine kinase